MTAVRIYTKRLCIYCHAARRLLTSLDIRFEEVSVDGRSELRRELSQANGGWPTVPMIFVGARFIGGYDDLRRLHRDERLLPMLQTARGTVGG